MLMFASNMPMFVYAKPADMRKGCYRLAAIVREEFRANPQDGSLFLFFNRRRDRLKALHWDGTGFWLYSKLLEAGRFEELPLASRGDGPCARIDATQLAMLLAGVSLTAKRHRRYRELPPKPPAVASASPEPRA